MNWALTPPAPDGSFANWVDLTASYAFVVLGSEIDVVVAQPPHTGAEYDRPRLKLIRILTARRKLCVVVCGSHHASTLR